MKIKKILIAIDDSKYAEHAAEYGFDLAHSYKAHVGLVNIVEPIILPGTGTDSITGIPFQTSNMEDAELIRVQEESSEIFFKKPSRIWQATCR